MTRTVNITVQGNTWHVSNVVGMTADELDDIAEQILSLRGLTGDAVVLFYTSKGLQRWNVADLRNCHARTLLLQDL
jgi:hypothetical protein